MQQKDLQKVLKCSVKKLFFKILHNLQGKVSVGDSFIITFVEKETPTQLLSCEFCKYF